MRERHPFKPHMALMSDAQLSLLLAHSVSVLVPQRKHWSHIGRERSHVVCYGLLVQHIMFRVDHRLELQVADVLLGVRISPRTLNAVLYEIAVPQKTFDLDAHRVVGKLTTSTYRFNKEVNRLPEAHSIPLKGT